MNATRSIRLAFVGLAVGLLVVWLGGCGGGESDGGGAGRAPNAVSDGGSCPHGLAGGSCPFCDPALVEAGGMCLGHGVPEALCFPCNPGLEPAFRAQGDWCEGHGVPESQCRLCNPGLARDTAGVTPVELPERDAQAVPADALPRKLRPPNVQCATESLLVRFRSPEVARAAGLGFHRVERKVVVRTIDATAEIEYDEDRHAHLAPRVAGVVSGETKDLGARVKAGEVLAWIDSVELGVAKGDLVRLRSTLETARQKAERARDTFDRLNRIEVRLTAVEYVEARELLAVARRNHEREEALLARGSASEKDLLDARAELLACEARFSAASKKLLVFGIPAERLEGLAWEDVEDLEGVGTTAVQDVLASEIELQAVEADLASARRKLCVLGLTAEEIVAVERDGESSSLLPLRAPFDGQVVRRDAARGEVVTPGNVLFEIADLSRMWGKLDLYERDAGEVRLGAEAMLRVEGLRGESFPGRVTWVSPEIDRRTRTVVARVELENPEGLLRAHMFGRAEIRVGEGEPRVVVPTEALQWEGCCNVVFVQRSDTLFEPRRLRLGFETNRYQIVEEGLEAGEVVVTTGSFLLKTEILRESIGAGCCEVGVPREE